MLGLRYFTKLWNISEYKRMEQDMSLGQLYDVQNELNILYTKHWLGLLIF
jgi:hypothetical protein